MSEVATFAELCARVPAGASTIADILTLRAAERPDAKAFGFIGDSNETVSLSFSELDRRVSVWAAAIAERTQIGDRIILLFRPGVDFIVAFFACQRAGTIPVPTALPRSREPKHRMSAMIANARPSLILSHTAAQVSLTELQFEAALLDIDTVPTGSAPVPAIRRYTDLAFLQYTSGSTGAPKGVMVSHANLMANVDHIVARLGLTHEDRGFSWLPTYHDMGLIGCVATPISIGAECISMAPAAFLRDPLRWLQSISAQRSNVSGGPNLAFDLCARRLLDDASRPDPQDLDLSCWRVAFVGAEPVRSAMLTRFAAAAAPYGFRPDAFLPSYGLAEATLLVTGGSGAPGQLIRSFDGEALGQGRVQLAAPASREKTARRISLVSCGPVAKAVATDVLVVDPERGEALSAGRVGEIWVSGAGITSGYWDRSTETAAAFGHRVNGHVGAFLRTGDLGFVHDGQLFISGRLHDVINISGIKYHPEDIEQTISARLPELGQSRSAVFAVESESGVRVIVAQELAREQRRTADAAQLAGAIRAAVWDVHALAVEEAIILSPGAMPLTSSGKVQRQRCRELYLNGELAQLAWTPPRRAAPVPKSLDSDALKLRAILAEVLVRPPEDIGLDRPLSSLGLDSLKTIEVQLLAQTRMGWDVAAESLHSEMTLLQIVERGAQGDRLGPGTFWMDAALPATLKPAAGTADGDGDAFVTGATGLVGAQVVRELLARMNGDIHCLVRGTDDEEARKRLLAHLEPLGIDPAVIAKRVHVLRGDASAPGFGLAAERFAALAARVGLVFHNAAKLDFLSPYATLRASNVNGVRTVLEFAAVGRPKLIAHTSSISTIESPARMVARVDEEAPLDFPDTLAVGYAQSKWVADAIICAARARGFAASIFRPSWIVGAENTMQSGDFVARFLEGCRRIGSLPESAYRWNLVPADYVARSTVALMLADRGNRAVYHLGATRSLSVPQLVSRLARLGAPLKIVPVEEWRAQLRAAIAEDTENPLRPIAGLFLRDAPSGAPADNYLMGLVPEMDSRRTRARLRQLAIDDPASADTLLPALLGSSRPANLPAPAAAD